MNPTEAGTREIPDDEQDLYKILIHVVLPVGTSMWAFTQAATNPSGVAVVLLTALAALSLFYGFNRLLAIADERLNKTDAISIDDI
jgi:hypothetical protein